MASENGSVGISSSLAADKSAVPSISFDPSASTTTAATQQSSPELSSSRLVTKQQLADSRHSPQPPSSTGSIPSGPLNATNPATSSRPKSSKALAGFAPAYSPRPMTGEAAMSDAKQLLGEKRRRKDWEEGQSKRTSVNPGIAALRGLVGSNPISRPRDAPSATTSLSEGMATAAKALSIPEPMQIDPSQHVQVSPTSISSILSLESSAATTTANSSTAPLPQIASLEKDGSHAQQPLPQNDPATPRLAPPMEDATSKKALSYPGMVTPNTPNSESNAPPRGTSLPMSGYSQNSPRSPSAKKHKCPYCSTDFTRHHNLKSHLLTHSQEKPYVCSTCQARFRRLHDLKRHTRLHTGERPHQCPRCGRQFARGDALARHNKGNGGCAGRRSSMGSFAGDDDFGDGPQDSRQGSMRGDDGMEGLMYTGDPENKEDRGDLDEEERRRSRPTIKAREASNAPIQNGQPQIEQAMYQSQYARTYPPAMGRHTTNQAGSLQPPSHPARGGSPSSSNQDSSHSLKAIRTSRSGSIGGGPSVFSQGITESPTPLSPGGVQAHQLGHNRSTNYSQHLPRLPPVQSATNPNVPQLPPLSAPESRQALGSQAGPSQQHHGQGQQTQSLIGNGTSLNSYHGHPGGALPGTSSFSNNGSSSGQQGSDGQGSFVPANQERLWAYVRSLEDRVNRLQGEVDHLRTQLGNQNRPPETGS
jgi:DNA-directed RNA polymerase subunit RPC12/RpoP